MADRRTKCADDRVVAERIYNDTYMYGADGLCPNVTAAECVTYRGGLYDSTQSDSGKVGASMEHLFDKATANWTTDDIVLKDGADDDFKLSQYEFGVRESTAHPYVNKGELGLGRDSAFLGALTTGRRIASKTYSFFWGIDITTSDNPRNGSLVLGGYDQALTGDAKNTTTKFNRDQWRCREGMIVELTGLNLQSISGNAQSIMGETKSLQACVVPTLSSVLTLPYQYWDTMAEIMGVETTPFNNGTSGEHFYRVASVKPASATFSGNLSITLNDEITITIPNEQLIFNEAYIAGNGQIKRNPDWMNIPIVKYMDLDQNMPRIGGMFFSSAALMVNHDKNEFTIAPVQENSAAQNLIGIDTANGCVTAVESGATTAPNAPGTPSSENSDSGGVSGGTIAGIVVGVIAVLVIVAGIASLVWKRRRGAVAPKIKTTIHQAEAAHDGIPIVEKCGYSTMEMPAEEMGGRGYAAELDGVGRPVEAPARGMEREGSMNRSL